jgi:hypothetical protein
MKRRQEDGAIRVEVRLLMRSLVQKTDFLHVALAGTIFNDERPSLNDEMKRVGG